jgi:hypothetical protein
MTPSHLPAGREQDCIDPDADLAAALSDVFVPPGSDMLPVLRHPRAVAEMIRALARLAREQRRASRSLRRAATEADAVRRLLATAN